MRFALALSVGGFVLCGAFPAMAQNYQSTTTAPTYVPSAAYTGQPAIPFYNTSAQPLPLQQMVAGKNAPSYNFGTSAKPYNLNATQSGNSGTLSPDQVDQMRAARDARAQQYEQQYRQQVAQSQQGQALNGAAANAYNSLMPAQNKPVPTKKRLVYRQAQDPLAAPPLLFNPDQ